MMVLSKKRILLAIWLIGLLAPILWALRLLFGNPSPVRISEQTTVLTGATLDDGSLDFSRALWKRCNSPIDDTANAGILLGQMPRLRPSHQRYQNLVLTKQIDLREDNWSDETLPNAYHELAMSRCRPWSGGNHPFLLDLVEHEQEFVAAWSDAVSRPRLVKPPGVTIEHIKSNLMNGADIMLRRAMLAAHEGNWEQAIGNLKSVDHAAELLAELQCGWEIQAACEIRSRVSLSLAGTLLEVHQIPAELKEYVRHRDSHWAHAAVQNAVDNALRIRFQILVRDLRNSPGRLRAIVHHGLTGNSQKALELQLTRIRNSINWSRVSEIQNECLDEILFAMRKQAPGEWWRESKELIREASRLSDTTALLKSVKNFHLANISTEIGTYLSKQSTLRYVSGAFFELRKTVERDQAARIALAMALYREERGSFPEQLSDLPDSVHWTVERNAVPGEELQLKSRQGTFEIYTSTGSLLNYTTGARDRYESRSP